MSKEVWEIAPDDILVFMCYTHHIESRVMRGRNPDRLRAYCRLRGYRVHIDTRDTAELWSSFDVAPKPHWNRYRILRELMRDPANANVQVFVYIDADCMVLNYDFDIARYVKARARPSGGATVLGQRDWGNMTGRSMQSGVMLWAARPERRGDFDALLRAFCEAASDEPAVANAARRAYREPQSHERGVPYWYDQSLWHLLINRYPSAMGSANVVLGDWNMFQLTPRARRRQPSMLQASTSWCLTPYTAPNAWLLHHTHTFEDDPRGRVAWRNALLQLNRAPWITSMTIPRQRSR